MLDPIVLFACAQSVHAYEFSVLKMLSELICPAERDPLHQGIIVQRSQLQGRNFQVDLSSRLGKTQVVTASTPLNQQVRIAKRYWQAVKA